MTILDAQVNKKKWLHFMWQFFIKNRKGLDIILNPQDFFITRKTIIRSLMF